MKVISFFSYKGGAGRSTLAYNVIPFLAANHFHPTAESPMIIVDTDVDSCGMSYLLEEQNNVTDTNCIQYLLKNGMDSKKYDSVSDHPFLSQLRPVGHKFGYGVDNAILLLPAKDNKNIDKDAKSNYSDANADSILEKFGSFIDVCEDRFDIPAIVLDSSVGNTATANISNNVADVIVCCMRPTIQFVNGTRRFFTAVERGEKHLDEGKEVIFVPNVIRKNPTKIDGVMYPDYAEDIIHSNFHSSFGEDQKRKQKYVLDMLDKDDFGIPAVESFMWREAQLYSLKNNGRQLEEDEEAALKCYEKLAKLICRSNED